MGSAKLTQVEQDTLDEFSVYAHENGILKFHNDRDLFAGRNAKQNAKRSALARLAKKGYLRVSKLGDNIYALPASADIEALRDAMDNAISAIRSYGLRHEPGQLFEAEYSLRREIFAWDKPTGRPLPEVETF